jgi:hypothetical protein
MGGLSNAGTGTGREGREGFAKDAKKAFQVFRVIVEPWQKLELPGAWNAQRKP